MTILKPACYSFRVTDYLNTRPNMEVFDNGDLRVYSYVYEYCDTRTKFDQRGLDYGLAQVMALKPKRYNKAEWENDKKTGKIIVHPEKAKNDIGLVAQEVREIIPEAVDVPQDETRQPWGIAYTKLIPVLVKAVQDQQQQIKKLEDKITRLEKYMRAK